MNNQTHNQQSKTIEIGALLRTKRELDVFGTAHNSTHSFLSAGEYIVVMDYVKQVFRDFSGYDSMMAIIYFFYGGKIYELSCWENHIDNETHIDETFERIV